MKIKNTALDILYITAGGVVYALAVNIFTAPNNIVPGGLTGVGTMVNYLFGVPIGTAIIIMNIPVFIVAYKKFGFSYIVKNLCATVVTSAAIDMTAPFLPVYRGDMILTSVMAGLLSGAGLSLIFMRGATTGGTDLIASIIADRFRHIPIGRMILITDFVVVAMTAAVYRSIETPLYSTVIIFIMSRVIDGILYGSSRGHGRLMFIISDKSCDIAESVIKRLKRGATILPSEGGYTGKKGKMLMCAVRKQEVYKVYDKVYEIDRDAFVMVTEAVEIIGEGFGDKTE